MVDFAEDPEDYPSYVRSAKFLDFGGDIDEELWTRNPQRYHPTWKFEERRKRLRDSLEPDDLKEVIMFGELWPAVEGNASFVRVVRGVALYIMVSAELRDDRELTVRPTKDQFPDLTESDFEYTAITIWPYVVDRDEAWAGGWRPDDLDFIEELAEQRGKHGRENSGYGGAAGGTAQ